ncbi:MAG: hypothetical protein ACYTGS_10940 [Planctomycetota bacterium]|jgi:hypothetical protein
MKPMETTQTSLDHLTWENPMGESRKNAGYEKSLVEVHRKRVKNIGFEGVLHDLGD